MNDFAIKSSSNIVKFSLDTSMKDTKPVVTETYEFELGDNSLLIALSRNFGQSRFRFEGQSEQNFKWIRHYKCRAFNQDLDGRNRTCRKLNLNKEVKIFKDIFFAIFRLS